MKFTVNAKDFYIALKKADKVRLHKSAFTPLEGVHISAAGKNCTLLATNHERWLSIPLKAEVKSPGSVTLDEIKALLKKIELLREDTLTFELPSEETSLKLLPQSGRNSYNGQFGAICGNAKSRKGSDLFIHR